MWGVGEEGGYIAGRKGYKKGMWARKGGAYVLYDRQ